MKVLYSGKYLRGFHKQLVDFPPKEIEYVLETSKQRNKFFEKKGRIQRFGAEIWNSKLGSVIGLIQRRNLFQYKEIDVAQSFNRFIKTNNGIPYIIYLENPTALFHYKLHRKKSYLSKKKLYRYARDESLYAIACMSQACCSSLHAVAPFIPSELYTTVIYPFVKENRFTNIPQIEKKTEDKVFHLLHISSDFMFKGGPEILEVLKKLDPQKFKLSLVTPPNSIPDLYKKYIHGNKPQIDLIPFNLNDQEMQQLYSNSHVLLHPTLKDSFALTVLEAIKSGLPVIGTNLYAIPEMVNDENGFLTSPPIKYFNDDNTPNEEVWGKDWKLIDREISSELTDFMFDKITLLNENRALLKELSINSFNKATNAPFSCEYIHNQWVSIYKKAALQK